jgi:hypothetical protein
VSRRITFFALTAELIARLRAGSTFAGPIAQETGARSMSVGIQCADRRLTAEWQNPPGAAP